MVNGSTSLGDFEIEKVVEFVEISITLKLI
jgi:hypothetical protein